MRLHEIQTAVRAAKDRRNDFGQYNYRTAEGILAEVKVALNSDESITLTDTIQEVAGQIFVSATATLFLDGGAVNHTAQGHAMHPLQKKGMDASQITGAASSYARKYALCGLLAVDDGSADPDAGDNRNENGQTPPPRDPVKIRDGMLDAVARRASEAELVALQGDAKFDAAWNWLMETDPDKGAEVTAAINAKLATFGEQE